MTTNLRSESFHIAGEQIAASLHDAYLALESFAEGNTGQEGLAKCAELLHTTRGALLVLEVYGASLLAEEMEFTCAFLVGDGNEPEELTDDGIEALSRAMVQLPAYVERIMTGGKDIPLVLLPLLNDLRAARGKALLSESTLLLLNVEPSSSGENNAQLERARSGEDIIELVGQLRPQFQLGLLGWIKDGSSQQSLQRMDAVAKRLELAASKNEIHQLWWVVGGVLEGLLSEGLESSIALKRLIGQADREIKRLQQLGEAEYVVAPPVDLVNNLLYYVARSTSGGERSAAIREAFNLSDVSPGDEQIEEVRESLSAPSPKLMRTVADAIREDLARAKDVLDIYVRTDMADNSDLQLQVGLLRKISDTMGVLGLGALREIVRQRSEELEKIIAADNEPQEAQLVDLAAALLEVESRLDGELIGLLNTRDEEPAEAQLIDPGFHEVTEAVMRECIINLAHIKDSITQILINTDDSAALDTMDEQLRGISAGLLMLDKVRAAGLLERIGRAIHQCVEADILTNDPDGINRLADSIVSLEYYMETLQAGRKEPEYMLDNSERSLDVLDNSASISLPTEAEVESHTQTLKVDTAHLELLPKAPPIVIPLEKTRVIEMPVLTQGDEQPDPELLEVFIEEAQEAIAAIKRHFPVWAENQSDEEALITVRRSFHTLKGSGRMVGAVQIGEYSWNIEDLLNRIINKTIEAGPGIIAFLHDVIDALPQLLEQLEVGTEPTVDLTAIETAAAIFAEGDIPERYALSAPAAVDFEFSEQDAVAGEELELETVAEAEEVVEVDDGPDPVLVDILTRESAGHLKTVRDYVRDVAINPAPYAVTEELHRACHTLHGSITMANVAAAAVIAEPLHHLIEQFYTSNTGIDDELLALCGRSADAIEAAVASLSGAEQSLPDAGELQSELQQAVERYVIEADDASADADEAIVIEAVEVETIELPDSGSDDVIDIGIEPAVIDEAAIADDADFDAEIAAIFAEEATEILAAADVAMASLAGNRSDPAPMSELQRHLHTLKGGARMAGVTSMGDFSHELESLIMRIYQGGTGLDDSAFGLLQASFDELHRMREQVMSGRVNPPATDLMARLTMVVEATMVTPVLVPEDLLAVADDAEELVATEEAVAESTEDEEVAITAPDKDDDAVAEEVAPELPVLVPENDRLGELARELTSGQPPTESQPLAENLTSTTTIPPLPEPVRREMARVDSAMLEDLLNNAGEISIFHSRLNQQMSAIQFNLVELGQTVHRLTQQLRLLEIETEAQILFRHQSESTGDEEFDPLELDRYSAIQQLSRGLAETASDVSSIKDLLQNTAADTETILLQQARTTSELQDNLMRTRMVPFDQHVPRLSRLVRQQAVESGKQVELIVEGSTGELDRQVMEKMLPPLEHMLRNAVIHGIETPEAREQGGKSGEARIVIRFRREGAQVLVDVADDGSGLNLPGIRKKAIDQGLIKPDQKLTDEETTQLILQSGLTTADKLTQSAGRGIGMDVVISEIAKLGGTLAIESITGKGCTFTVRLPYTLAITQAFIVKVGPDVYALPLPTVEGVVRLPRREFDDLLQQDEPAVPYGGRRYRLRHLGTYLGLGPATIPADEEQVAVILVEAGENSAALIVDETADSREIVVKPIGPQLASIRGLAGATILGDGRIVVILDPGSLVRSAIPGSLEVQSYVTEEDDLSALALVVDDSITMRRVTQRLLERNGMRVITAKDGVEALEVLQDHYPNIVILDIEMPRMDGYEFAGHVRNNPETANLPIVMVTSRTGEKHRARAIELGVNDYLGKPYQEHEMLDAIRHLLGENFNASDKVREHDAVS